MNLYVGNLSYDLSEDELRSAFEQFGSVSSCNIIIDRDTGRSKGFGFVEMDDNGEAEAAIEALNESPLKGRPLRVSGTGHSSPSRRKVLSPLKKLQAPERWPK